MIPDDGIQYNHPDLKQNYDPHASKDINDGDDDPMPQVDDSDDDNDDDDDSADDDCDDDDDNGDINGGDDDDSSLKLIKTVFLRIAFLQLSMLCLLHLTCDTNCIITAQ